MANPSIRCPMCSTLIVDPHGNQKFCSKKCRQNYWSNFVEPREICEDCGTLLGVSSASNIRTGKNSPYCRSCSSFRRHGTGRDI